MLLRYLVESHRADVSIDDRVPRDALIYHDKVVGVFRLVSAMFADVPRVRGINRRHLHPGRWRRIFAGHDDAVRQLRFFIE